MGGGAVVTTVKPEVVAKVEAAGRLKGYVCAFVAQRGYGFIEVSGVRDETTGQLKQWHFHNNCWRGKREIAVGLAVTFMPVSVPRDVAKRDKATEIEVVG